MCLNGYKFQRDTGVCKSTTQERRAQAKSSAMKSDSPMKRRDDDDFEAGTLVCLRVLLVINKHGEFIYVEPLVGGRSND